MQALGVFKDDKAGWEGGREPILDWRGRGVSSSLRRFSEGKHEASHSVEAVLGRGA